MKYGKIWGHTTPLLVTPTIEVHKIFSQKGRKCSEHKHQFKWNAFYCISGNVNIFVQKASYPLTDKTNLQAGGITTVSPGETHWFEAEEDSVLLELYYMQALSEDIIRKNTGGVVAGKQ